MVGAKIIKPGGGELDAFEKTISQALLELELNSELKPQLRDLHITRARELEFATKKVSFQFHWQPSDICANERMNGSRWIDETHSPEEEGSHMACPPPACVCLLLAELRLACNCQTMHKSIHFSIYHLVQNDS